MTSVVKSLNEVLQNQDHQPPSQWHLRIVSSGDCQSYVAWNQNTHEALIVDPKKEDLDTYLNLQNQILKMNKDYRWLGVIDTHTHADHVSVASHLAELLKAPVIMNHLSATTRVDLRVSKNTSISSAAGPVRFLLTPGHTPDGMCITWGPFCFTGDTVFFNDCGRDDLPGGDPVAHYNSLQLLKKELAPEYLVCPGHDPKGGRISVWGEQLKSNSSLTQDEKSFVEESIAFDAPAPALLKKSLFENLK